MSDILINTSFCQLGVQIWESFKKFCVLREKRDCCNTFKRNLDTAHITITKIDELIKIHLQDRQEWLRTLRALLAC